MRERESVGLDGSGSKGDDGITQLGWFDRRVIDPIDGIQRKARPIAFTFAVLKRFSEDRGSQYAALLSYYGFFSLLAILLVLGTIAAAILAEDPERKKSLIEAITGSLPVTGETVASNVQTLGGSGIALVAGVLFAAWSGLGVVNNAQDAFNTMWSVPRYRWPNLWTRIGRSAAGLSVAGIALVALTAGGPILSAFPLGWFQLVLAAIGAAAVNTIALVVCLDLLTRAKLTIRSVLPGAFAGAVALVMLQFFGTFYMTRVVARAGAFYGTFAAAMGVLVWIGLQARLILLASEINVVLAKRLWPRSLTGRRLGESDERALADLVARESNSEDLIVESKLARDPG